AGQGAGLVLHRVGWQSHETPRTSACLVAISGRPSSRRAPFLWGGAGPDGDLAATYTERGAGLVLSRGRPGTALLSRRTGAGLGTSAVTWTTSTRPGSGWLTPATSPTMGRRSPTGPGSSAATRSAT